MEDMVLIVFMSIMQILVIIAAFNFFIYKKAVQKIKEAEAKANEAKAEALEAKAEAEAAEAKALEAEAKAKDAKLKKPSAEEIKEAVEMGRKEVSKLIKRNCGNVPKQSNSVH